MERVSIIKGVDPFLIVAPHNDKDDYNCGFIAEEVAKKLDAYAVINNGWDRAEKFDYWTDKANCNDVRHLHEDVIKQEFLEPILNFASRIEKQHRFVYMFVIHGVGNYIQRVAADGVDAVIGFGDGHPPSYSCDPALKDYFIYQLEQVSICAYEGAAGGKFAGRAKNNLNQLFRRWYPDKRVQSMQVEIIYNLREEKDIASYTAEAITVAIENILDYDDTTKYLTHTARGKI